MTGDRRRSQWIAWDSGFYGGNLADGLAGQFGAAGIVIWNAYLCACKRSLVPGQISVYNDLDTLSQLGIPWLNQVNETGDAFTLDALWTYLGRMKQVKRTRRGRATYITCTRWAEWQQDAHRDIKAKRKASSRLENTETLGADTETETYTETDTETDSETRHTHSEQTLAAVHDLPLLPTGFDAFWQHWPEQARQMRDDARRAWTAARGNGASEVAILVGVDAWSAHWTAAGTDPQYIPHPANWIKKKRWLDPPPAAPLSKGDKQNRDIIANAIEFAGGEP